MGVGTSLQLDLGEEIYKSTDPAKPDWIIKHAEATGLSIVEVERLWMRFAQLGCNSYGVLPVTSLKLPKIDYDIFMRNVLSALVGGRGYVTFNNFLLAAQWFEKATVEEKAQALFNLINGGQPVPLSALEMVMTRIYSTEDKLVVDRHMNLVMQLVDDGTGTITAAQFIRAVQNLPPARRDQIFAFNIIPPEVSANAVHYISLLRHRNEVNWPTAYAYRVGPAGIDLNQIPNPKVEPVRVATSYAIPTDMQLDSVASRVATRDFAYLGNRLGFFESDMRRFEQHYPGNRKEQVMFMLKQWRLREGASAYVINLQKALNDTGLADVAVVLVPGYREMWRS